MSAYTQFLQGKLATQTPIGIEVEEREISDALFPFQRDLVRWALRRGRAAIFADTGLGKTRMQLEWASHVLRATGRSVLILTPLAVAAQTVREADAIGLGATYCKDASEIPLEGTGIVVTNYERLHHFDAQSFDGVVLDESSCLKDYSSSTRNQLIESFGATPFRLACTATPAPNDHQELGNHAEFLGVCKRTEMLSTYFVHDGGSTQDWRLKGHAVDAFWRWVASWAAMIRRSSDLGYSDEGYDLPPLVMRQHVVSSSVEKARAATESGKQVPLFAEAATTLADHRRARSESLLDRVRVAAELVAKEPYEPWLIWCELNKEGDAIEAELARLVPGALQISGSDKPDVKERAMLGFCRGEPRIIITKPSIAGMGMNWQHCARIAFVGISHSFEQYYQAVRRCYRFGQKREVHCHVIISEAEGNVLDNLRRKEADANEMARRMVTHMRDLVRESVGASSRTGFDYAPKTPLVIPHWL